MTALTPVVMGGALAADTNARSVREFLRVPSLRGILRFWFRAAVGGYLAVPEWQHAEIALFGSTSEASPLRLRIPFPASFPAPEEAWLRMNDRTNNIKRRALPPETSFPLVVSSYYAPQTHAAEVTRFSAALGLLTALGGVGARTRRGFGSLTGNVPPLCYPCLENSETLPVLVERHVQGLLSALVPAAVSPATVSLNPTVSVLRRGRTRLFVIQPQHRIGWPSWTDAMNGLRETYYRGFKQHLKKTALGSARPRRLSPLHLQIKSCKTAAGNELFFGVVVVFLHTRTDEDLTHPDQTGGVLTIDTFRTACSPVIVITEIAPWPTGT